MPRPLFDTPAADLYQVLSAALDGTGPAIGVGLVHPISEVPDEVAIAVRTSGSTGEPRTVMLTATALISSAEATAARLGGTGQWLLGLPIDHIAGLQILVRSVVAGIAPVRLPTGPFRPDQFLAGVAEMKEPGYCSLVPTQLLRLLDDPRTVAALANFRAVLVGGAAVGSDLLDRAIDAGIQVVTTYGATETSGGAVYDGEPLSGVTVAVVDDRIQISGPVLALGYLNQDELTSQVFPIRNGKRWFASSDLGRQLPDGRIEVLGRADDIIVTGGVKVAPLAVENVIAGLSGVREVCVVGLPDRHWGHAVTAVIVGDPSLELEQIRAAVTTRLGSISAPRNLMRVDALPTRPSGKPDRAAVALLATHMTPEVRNGAVR